MSLNKNSFMKQLWKSYPALNKQAVESLIHENLISPFIVKLPQSILDQAKSYISTAFRLRKNKNYLELMKPSLEKLGISDPGNHSIMMSYDFHLDTSDQLKLIEINTNAAFYLLGCELYDCAGIKNPFSENPRELVREGVLNELKLFKAAKSNPSIAIIDDQPQSQKLFAEFLCFQELFKSWGWSCEILDFRDLKIGKDFVYNRYTDFYLSDPKSKNLLDLFSSKAVCFSPNPHEYHLLADKSRIIDWTSDGFFKKIEGNDWTPGNSELMVKHTPKTFLMSPERASEIWTARKNLFFKPRAAYGAKQSYKGASISQKIFQELLDPKFIAQELVPAPERVFKTPEGHDQVFKFDLRFYAYEDHLQMGVARIYQGQVTNLKTTYGGFACLEFGS